MNRPEISSAARNDEAARETSEPRFAFGKNWQRFLEALTEERIAEAEKSLRTMLAVDDLSGKSFLDIGSGSGLFSLAAMRLGASRVHSFDYDPHSVACTQELKRRYCSASVNWSVEQASVLDRDYLSRLGQFDVVYSWGVLHHTGNMWQALENAATPVGVRGKLFIALYNDQGWRSRAWKAIKRRYSQSSAWRFFLTIFFTTFYCVKGFVADVVRLRNPLRRYRTYKQSRGMQYFADLRDWIGGYPFEVAKPEAVCAFFETRGFDVAKLKSVGRGPGNNEFVFSRRVRSGSV